MPEAILKPLVEPLDPTLLAYCMFWLLVAGLVFRITLMIFGFFLIRLQTKAYIAGKQLNERAGFWGRFALAAQYFSMWGI